MKVEESRMLEDEEIIGYCPEEQDFLPGKLSIITFTQTVNRVRVSAPHKQLRCLSCGNLLTNEDIQKENFRVFFDAYKKKVGLLTSEEIKHIRAKRKWSQRKLARFLGIGEKDITRYENGSVQTKSIDNMMRLVNDDQAFERMNIIFEENKKGVE